MRSEDMLIRGLVSLSPFRVFAMGFSRPSGLSNLRVSVLKGALDSRRQKQLAKQNPATLNLSTILFCYIAANAAIWQRRQHSKALPAPLPGT